MVYLSRYHRTWIPTTSFASVIMTKIVTRPDQEFRKKQVRKSPAKVEDDQEDQNS
jgi:hypothetical protein